MDHLELRPTADKTRFRAADGRILTPPADWALLPPGDAAMTRRVKAAGPSWTVVERKGRKAFSHGVWAPASVIERVRAELAGERATPEYQRRRAGDVRRRALAQEQYAEDFAAEVKRFLGFAAEFEQVSARLAAAVTEHATPVGSGTVARTERIPVEERAAAAVIAWMRHQTTAYDSMTIQRVKGRRREVRRDLARQSRALLDAHRGLAAHPPACSLCAALKAAG